VILIRGRVTYLDGEVVDFEVTQAVMAEWEIYAHRHGFPFKPDEAPPILYWLVLAWAASGTEEGFDTWRRRVAEALPLGEDAVVEIPPTRPEPSIAGRSSSP